VRIDSEGLFFTYMTDMHLSAIPPGRRTGDYRGAILKKIETIQEWTNRLNGVCLCGGDVFHIKKPMSKANPKGLITEVIDLFGGFNTGKVWGVVGNHDIEFDRHDTLNNQPLGVLCHAGVYEPIRASEFFTDRDGLVVEVVGFDYADDMTMLDEILAYPPRSEGVDYRIGIAHAMARPGGAQNMFGSPIIGYDLLEDIDFDVFLWGHDHSRVEPTEVGICTHFHPGSLARAALAQDEVERPIMALGLKFDKAGWGFKERELTVEPLEIAFRTGDKKVLEANKGTEYKAFISQVTTDIGEINVSDPIEIIKELCGDDQELVDLIMQVCDMGV
jgi:DNA repair exonuclease SbcCD nuclease subunit